MDRLKDKVIIVTGGSNGMGASHAKLFVEEGAKVVITDINENDGQNLADKLGENAIFIKHDVTQTADWEHVIKETKHTFNQIDGLVNNAGITGENINLEKLTDEEYHKVIAINQFSVYKGMQSVIPSLKANGKGSIVNISSTSGIIGTPKALPYTASKFAVRGMTKSAALELAEDNIRVNSVHPGGIKTKIKLFEGVADNTPLGRVADAGEVSYLVLYLLSDESSFTTGAEHVIDGGLTAE